MSSRRHLSRIAVMQTIFEMQARSIDAEKSLVLNMGAQEGGQRGVDEAFCETLLTGIRSRWDDIRQSIETFAPQWPLDRMDPVTRAILFLGAYELLFGNDAPPAVVMNEAIEMAKEFGNADSGKFVNGVLNALAQSMQTNKV